MVSTNCSHSHFSLWFLVRVQFQVRVQKKAYFCAQINEALQEYQFTIIVPVYNEEENLPRVEKELLAYTKIASKKTSILFVNDGSKDNSQPIIEEICQRNEAFNFINFKENRGLSAAIKAGFDYVKTPLLGYIDSDLQTAPEDFNLLLEKIGEYDLVTGVRANRKDKFVKNLFANKENVVLKNKIKKDTEALVK